jgi:hypothetical protein
MFPQRGEENDQAHRISRGPSMDTEHGKNLCPQLKQFNRNFAVFGETPIKRATVLCCCSSKK